VKNNIPSRFPKKYLRELRKDLVSEESKEGSVSFKPNIHLNYPKSLSISEIFRRGKYPTVEG